MINAVGSFLAALVFLLCAQAASAAQGWTCTYKHGAQAVTVHFELSPSDLIQTAPPVRYRIMANNDMAVIAISSFADMAKGHSTAQATAVVIDKGSGTLWLTPSTASRSIEGQCRPAPAK